MACARSWTGGTRAEVAKRRSARTSKRPPERHTRGARKWRLAMANQKMSLCPMCTHCPEVEVAGDEVRIGEAGNLAILKKDEWNALVELIQSGQLGRL